MPLLSVFLCLAVFTAILSSAPRPGAEAHRVAVMVPGPGPGPGPVLTRRSVVPLGYIVPVPLQRRRVHLLDPRTALNLVAAHESHTRSRRKRPAPYGGPRGPRGPRGKGRGPPRPSYKGHPKRKGQKPRDKPWMQATRGSSPAATRVRYRTNKPPRRVKGSKSKGPPRPPVPSYADGYAEDEDLRDEENDDEPERPFKRPPKSSKPSKTKSSKPSKPAKPTKSSYPKGWGPDGGYRVPAPEYPPYGPPYGTEEDEPGTGHLDLEERFINQHNQFYRHGYPTDGSEHKPISGQANKNGYYEDEEIEVADVGDEFPPPDGVGSASSPKRRPASGTYRRPTSNTKYSTYRAEEDGGDDSREEEVVRRRPSSKSKSRDRGQQDDRDNHRQSMYHAKFREDQRDHQLSAANFNYELSGAASETATSSTKLSGKPVRNNHRPAASPEPDAKPSDANFFRTRKPQYWG